MCSIAVGEARVDIRVLRPLPARGRPRLTAAPPPGPPADRPAGRGLPAPVRFDFGWPRLGSSGPRSIVVRPLSRSDVEVLAFAFRAVRWPRRPAGLFRRYLADQAAGAGPVLVAEADGVTAGYACLSWGSGYPPFHRAGVPEIADLAVLPEQRRRGVGTALFEVVEGVAAGRAPVVGLGCGLHAGFGPAQRLCARRGYLPDGRGVQHAGRQVPPYAVLRLDDTARLMLTKRLR